MQDPNEVRPDGPNVVEGEGPDSKDGREAIHWLVNIDDGDELVS